jgi:hypothetical protein
VVCSINHALKNKLFIWSEQIIKEFIGTKSYISSLLNEIELYKWFCEVPMATWLVVCSEW